MSPRAFLWALPLGAILWLGIFLVVAHAADWMMVVTEPGKAPVVRHIFYNGSGTECRTDRWGQIYMLPSGTRVSCERLVPSKEAAR